MKHVTQQQKKFVTEYIKTLNGELSAQKAGYKSKDLKTTASELLSSEIVIKEIRLTPCMAFHDFVLFVC